MSKQVVIQLHKLTNICDALSNLLNNISIRFGTKLYRQVFGIPMGTKCATLLVGLFLYCYDRDSMDYLNHGNQAVLSRLLIRLGYLDDQPLF